MLGYDDESLAQTSGCFVSSPDDGVFRPKSLAQRGEETGDESDESETGMTVLEEGVWWCVTAQATVTATYADDSSQDIEEEPTGGSPTWCECAPEALDDFLDGLPPAGFDAMILASDDVNYQGQGIRPLEFRQLIWDGFLLHCDALAAGQAEGHESNNCGSNNVIDKTEPTLTAFSPRADCTVGEVYGNGDGMIPPPLIIGATTSL